MICLRAAEGYALCHTLVATSINSIVSYQDSRRSRSSVKYRSGSLAVLFACSKDEEHDGSAMAGMMMDSPRSPSGLSLLAAALALRWSCCCTPTGLMRNCLIPYTRVLILLRLRTSSAAVRPLAALDGNETPIFMKPGLRYDL